MFFSMDCIKNRIQSVIYYSQYAENITNPQNTTPDHLHIVRYRFIWVYERFEKFFFCANIQL